MPTLEELMKDYEKELTVSAEKVSTQIRKDNLKAEEEMKRLIASNAIELETESGNDN